jgi:inward rectifier potassium channel
MPTRPSAAAATVDGAGADGGDAEAACGGVGKVDTGCSGGLGVDEHAAARDQDRNTARTDDEERIADMLACNTSNGSISAPQLRSRRVDPRIETERVAEIDAVQYAVPVSQRNVAPPPPNANIKVRTVGRSRRLRGDIYHFVLDRSWPQYIGLLAATFFILNVLFALIYRIDPTGVANVRDGSLEDCFYFSVQTLATIGYGAMAPVDRFAHIVVTIEAITGTISIALIAGITFAKFARPTAQFLFADKAVVGPRDGVPHLAFRMANWRHNQVFDARLRVVLLSTRVTAEGELTRTLNDVPLVRNDTAFFVLTWTAMHRIDESSPFHGPDALERLRAAKAELFLSLSGIDETIGQSIYARKRYGLDDIVWNARFADVITLEDDGTRVVDYEKFHVTE